MLGIHFDKTAPNFKTEKDILNWSPTSEEIKFIIETFDLFSHRLSKNHDYKLDKKTSNQSGKKEEEPPVENIEPDLDVVEPLKAEQKPEENAPNPDKTTEESDEKIFVQAREETIDEALTRNKGEPAEEFMVEADEKTIIDKVLKQKLKNKK
jgi:hypothetical protein